MGPIESIGVMNDTHPKRVELDNPADVQFRRDTGKRASWRNRTSAGLSKIRRVQ